MEFRKITQEDMLVLLNKAYNHSINGFGDISPPIDKFANDYLKINPDIQIASKKMFNNQIIKCTTSGALSNLGGIVTLPVAIPANVGSVLYVQMRMIACAAYMAGYDLDCDQTQTFVYACLAGVSINQIAKRFGVELSKKITMKQLQKIPGESLIKINQKVGFRLFTKFGERGLINFGKMIPIVGAGVGGGSDFLETKLIAIRAKKTFVDHPINA